MKRSIIVACCTLLTLVLVAQPFPPPLAANSSELRRDLAEARSAKAGRAAVTDPPKTTNAEVTKWMTDLSNWGRWGQSDQIGTLNLITPEKRKAAMKLVRDGVSVSLAHTLDKEPPKWLRG